MRQKKRDLVIFQDALEMAIKNGYEADSLTRNLFSDNYATELVGPFRLWATGVIFSKDFAKALWGSAPTKVSNVDLVKLTIWAKQVAVRHKDKLYSVPEGAKEMAFIDPIDEMKARELDNYASISLVDYKRTTKQIEDLVAQIAFETHSVKDVELETDLKEYEYQLQKMALEDNPFEYLEYSFKGRNRGRL